MSSFEKRRRKVRRRQQNRSLPGIEILEHRVTPPTFHVNSLLDTVAVNFKTGKDASGHISFVRPFRQPMPSRMPTRSFYRKGPLL